MVSPVSISPAAASSSSALLRLMLFRMACTFTFLGAGWYSVKSSSADSVFGALFFAVLGPLTSQIPQTMSTTQTRTSGS